MGISDRGRYKKSVFLWYSIFDPSADPAESQLETGDTDEAGSPRQFPVSGASLENDHGLSGRCGTDIHWSGYFTEKKQSLFNRKENHHMFERIKPTTQIRTVALPGDIADTLQYVYLCNKIEKRGIIIKGNHGGLRVVHNARIRDTYVPIEESWLAEFQKRFPDYELPTSDIAPYSQFGAVIFFSCFETNLSDEDIWTIVEIIINDDDSDRELLYTKMRKKAAEENNRLFVLENL